MYIEFVPYYLITVMCMRKGTCYYDSTDRVCALVFNRTIQRLNPARFQKPRHCTSNELSTRRSYSYLILRISLLLIQGPTFKTKIIWYQLESKECLGLWV